MTEPPHYYSYQNEREKEKWTIKKGKQWWDLWWTLERVNSHLMWLEWIMVSYLKEINLKRTFCSLRFNFQWDFIELEFFTKWKENWNVSFSISIWGSNELNTNTTLKWNNSKLKGNIKLIYNKLNQKEKIELKHKGLERMRFKRKNEKSEWMRKNSVWKEIIKKWFQLMKRRIIDLKKNVCGL